LSSAPVWRHETDAGPEPRTHDGPNRLERIVGVVPSHGQQRRAESQVGMCGIADCVRTRIVGPLMHHGMSAFLVETIRAQPTGSSPSKSARIAAWTRSCTLGPSVNVKSASMPPSMKPKLLAGLITASARTSIGAVGSFLQPLRFPDVFLSFETERVERFI
jgi:hypothetical protein